MKNNNSENPVNKSNKGLLMVIISIAMVIAVLFVFVIFSYKDLYSGMEQTTLESCSAQLDLASEKMDSFLRTAEDVVIVTSNTIEYMIDSGASNEEILDYLTEQTNWGIGEVNVNFTGLYGYYNGEYLDGNGWDPWADGEEYDPTARPWYKGGISAGGKVCFVPPYLDMDTGNIVLSVTKMLKDGRSVCGLDITLEEVKTYASELNSYGSDFAYILDRSGIIVSSKNNDVDWSKNYIADKDDDGDIAAVMRRAMLTDEPFEHHINGVNYLILSKTIAGNWQVLVATNPDEVFSSLKIFAKYAMILIALFILIGVLYIAYSTFERRRVKSAEQRATASDKAKTTFLFNMSHDIRTPMNAIIGFTEMAKKHIDDRERVEECLNKLEGAGNHLLGLINDVLDMARIESGKVEMNIVPINIGEACQTVMDLASEECKKKDLRFEIHQNNLGTHNVYGDPLRTEQIILNIVSNAIKYTKPGGSVDIYLNESEGSDDEHVTFSIAVKDTGIGMSEEFVGKIFEKFERANSSTVSEVQGTGLGMSIVKQLVDMLNGKIEVESELGVGTTVTVTFDCRVAASAKKAEESESADKSVLVGKKVLLVEDNELNREIAVDILEDLGMIVTEATDGTDAVELCAETCKEANVDTHFDVILMDIQMPVMDGYKATEEIRSLKDPLNIHTPIIAMTANAFAEDRRKSAEAGMDAHLAKPIDVDELVKTLCSFFKE